MTPAKTFTTQIEGVGAFVFRRRTLRDEIRIGAEHERLTEGLESVSEGFRRLTYMLAALGVLTVDAPPGWDPMDLDPLDPATFDKVGAVYGGLREAEERFRGAAGQVPPGAGEGQG
jgi:hypothetical protein